ncbi:MAG: M3 family oligoendopeptidase [Alphaproteobacteria bacterium]
MAEPARSEPAPTWDLRDLYTGLDDPALGIDLDRAEREAADLAATYKGKVKDLDGDALAQMIQRYERLSDQLGRVASYAGLRFAAQRDDAELGRFYQGVQERINAITTPLLFVSLELNRIDDADLEAKIAGSPPLKPYRPWLRDLRAFRPHQLDDAIEETLHEKAVAGRSAWVRLFDETMAELRFSFRGEELASAQIFDKLQDHDRDVRKDAGHAIATTLSARIRLFTRITNTLAKDKQIEDRWRGFARPISARNLANHVEDEVVDALIAAVREAYPRLSHRYYQMKARWLGLDRLAYFDRNAPLPEDDDRRIAWDDAKVLVLDSYRDFSPKLADILQTFFARNWIDAELRTGKDSGAFCHPTVPSAHPYVLMNYQGRARDVMTLAHELGHGVHQVLAAEQGPLMASTPLTLAETASVFGEQLTFRRLLAGTTDPKRRRVLLAGKIEDALNTVVRQIAFCEFERRVHDARREQELTADDLAGLWMAVQTESLGPAFDFADDYKVFWSYIPHFVHVPFYVYAYAFGDCLVNALVSVYEQEPAGFEAKYLDLLRAGGTRRHDELLAPFGLDARDPAFWTRGLDVIAGMIDDLEEELPA